jgi:hypothetical protein
MRAHTITIRSRATRNARKRVLALVLAVTALAIPATASADPPGSDHSVYSFTGGSSQSDYSSLNSITGGSTESSSFVGSPYVGSDHSSLSSITGPPSGEPIVVSGPPVGASDGFDWADAALGAGAALALAAFGAAALLTVRRRTAMSPST